MSATSIFGYANKISVRPGDSLDVFVSATGATHAQAQLVRLIHGDAHPDGPGYRETEIASPICSETMAATAIAAPERT